MQHFKASGPDAATKRASGPAELALVARGSQGARLDGDKRAMSAWRGA